MRGLPRTESIDFAVYLRAIPLLLRNPIILLGPLLCSLIVALVDLITSGLSGTGGGLLGGLVSLLTAIISVFGMALAIVVSDMVWRRGQASFDEAWEEVRRKAPDIVMAALGFTMVIYVAQYIGLIFGPIAAILLSIVALGITIYSIAVATIGGVPGGLALQASLDLAKRRPRNTILLTITSIIWVFAIGTIGASLLFTVVSVPTVVAMIITACFQALTLGYVGTVIAKRYADIAFRDM